MRIKIMKSTYRKQIMFLLIPRVHVLVHRLSIFFLSLSFIPLLLQKECTENARVPNLLKLKVEELCRPLQMFTPAIGSRPMTHALDYV